MRDRIMGISIVISASLLVAGLFYTQVIRYGHYLQLSKNNVIRIIPIDGPRGNIFDRNALPLVSNRLSFDVAVVYQELRDRQKFIRILSESLKMSGHDIVKALDKARARPYAPGNMTVEPSLTSSG